MALSKLEIQQMLREMNVKFDADEPFEALKQRLQQENHRRWLKSMEGNRAAGDGTGHRVVRKRRHVIPPSQEHETGGAGSAEASPPTTTKSAKADAQPPSRKSERDFKQRPIEKPAPGQPWKEAADGTEPFNRKKKVFDSVLRRARMCCERCGIKAGEGPLGIELEPYHLLPLSQGGEHSIKNVVALCPSCRETVEKDRSAREIKELKRKTRSKLYDTLQVVRKKPTRSRRPFAGR